MKSVLFSSAALIVHALPLMAAAPAFAQSQLTYPHLDDENVVVSATRLPTPLANVASSVTVITAADIEARQDRSLPDVLREVPGLSIVQTGGAGGQTSVFMRGSNSNHTKVLVDRIDVGDTSTPTGAADISKFLAGDIARVEILRGPQGALYGSDAIGGVINITTQSGSGPMRFTGSVEGGSFETSNQFATLSGQAGDFHYRATVQYFHSGGTPVTPLNLLPAGVVRNDDAYDNVTASTKLGYDITGNFDIGLTSRYYNSVGRITGDSFDPVTFASAPSARQTRIANLQYETRGTAHLVLWDGRFDQTLGFAYGSNIIATQDPNTGNGRTRGDRVKLDWQGNVKLAEGETLVLGAETARDALHRGLSFGFPTTLAQGITTNAGYAEMLTDLPIGFHNSFSVRDDDNSRFGNRVTWRMAPSWVIESTGTTLRASAGSGFKAPALQQLFGTFGGNASLKPESSTGYEAGIDQKILGDDLVGGVTWFHNDIRNLITSGPAPAFLNINIGRARTQGIETFLTWKALETLTFRADYTYTDSLDAATRAALLRRPRNKASLGADWQAMDDLQLNATLLYVGQQIEGNRDFSIPRLKQSDHVTLDLAASYKLTDMWSLFGRIENATDTNYQSPEGFLRPGIGAYGGIKVNL